MQTRALRVAVHQSEALGAPAADSAALAGGAVGVAGRARPCAVDIKAVVADGAEEVVDRVALHAVLHLGAHLAGSAACAGGEHVVEALPAVGAAVVGVAGQVDLALSVSDVGAALAGEAVSGLVVAAGEAGQLALGDTDTGTVGGVAVDADRAEVVAALFATLRARRALAVDELQAGRAVSALGDVERVAVRAAERAASTSAGAADHEALFAGDAGVSV